MVYNLPIELSVIVVQSSIKVGNEATEWERDRAYGNGNEARARHGRTGH